MKISSSRNINRKVPATFLVLPAMFVTTEATAGSEVVIEFQVNDLPTVVIEQDPGAEDGDFGHFVGEYVDPDAQWSLNWNYWLNDNPIESAVFLGSATIKNMSGAPADFRFTMETDLCPSIEQESLMGAFVVVQIQTDDDGGAITHVPGASVWSALADGDVAWTLFDSPFTLGSSGQGTASLSASFGAPFPSEPTMPVNDAAALEFQFNMTSGDTATFDTTFYVTGEEANLVPCEPIGDLNGDGVVDVLDLVILINNWGPCADPDDCIADLNGDGIVNAQDLIMLISNWG